MEPLEKSPATEADIRRRIQELIAIKGGGANPDLVEDVIENALKMLQDVKDRGDARVMAVAMKELRLAYKLFEPFADKRKVTIFGSARTLPTRAEYQHAHDFARKMAAAGWMVITGAGPGIMQAGHEGAGPENSFGANIRLPWEQTANPIIQKDKKLITFKYFFTRKLTFLRNSDAIVLFAGGFGTLDEGFEALTLMQTGKSRLMPLIMLDPPGTDYWHTWDRTIREHLLRNKLISIDDLHLYECTDDVDHAVRVITKFYRNYHSMRFVHDKLVIRLQHAPSESALRALNEDFAEIMVGEKIRVCEPFIEEREDDQYLHLPRICFDFDRRHYGRLRQLVDVLNTL